MRAEINELVLIGSPTRPAVGASVQVNRRSGGAATVYLTETGSTTKTNPVTTDSFGRIDGWVEAGSYTLIVTKGSTTYTQPFEAVIVRSVSVASDPGSSFTTSVTPGTSTTVYDANDARVQVSVYNVHSDPAAVVWVSEGATATVGSGHPLYPGGPPYSTDTYLGAVSVASSTASVALSGAEA